MCLSCQSCATKMVSTMNTPLRAPEKDNFQERKSRILQVILEGCVFVHRRLKIFLRSAKGLRQAVLTTLHSAHQGVTGMMLRAGISVYWPRITADIQTVRDRCMSCNRTAPTQPKLPPVTPVVPQYPFEHVCMDYMTLDGHSYGIFVDRFTNWPGVYHGSAAPDVVIVLENCVRTTVYQSRAVQMAYCT